MLTKCSDLTGPARCFNIAELELPLLKSRQPSYLREKTSDVRAAIRIVYIAVNVPTKDRISSVEARQAEAERWRRVFACLFSSV